MQENKKKYTGGILHQKILLLCNFRLGPNVSSKVSPIQPSPNYLLSCKILGSEKLFYSVILYMIDAVEDGSPPRIEEKQWPRP
jgi:hypothetical protein